MHRIILMHLYCVNIAIVRKRKDSSPTLRKLTAIYHTLQS